MSKNENDQQNNSTDSITTQKGEGKNVLTIEEHRKNLNIDAPVFVAVMQTKGWSNGKRVPEAIFKKAVNDFLNAPIGGN
jgi:hypothetical protein